jgi:hypothetical protein
MLRVENRVQKVGFGVEGVKFGAGDRNQLE